jgi:hypothetical protein
MHGGTQSEMGTKGDSPLRTPGTRIYTSSLTAWYIVLYRTDIVPMAGSEEKGNQRR